MNHTQWIDFNGKISKLINFNWRISSLIFYNFAAILSRGGMSYRNWYRDWGHCGVTNDLGSSPQPEGEARGRWWASQVVGDTTMTEIEASISILSWCLKAYWIYADSGVYKQQIAHKTASNQPLWKAWPQTIVTAASLVTSWLPLWYHSDARVTKYWQYASLKN